jgi:hypothetical protein
MYNKCRYCGGTNLKKIPDESYLSLDAYNSSAETLRCEDCRKRIKKDISNIGKFVKDYKKICKKHNMLIKDWGICEGSALSDMDSEEFDELLSDKMRYIIEKSFNRQKEIRLKQEKDKGDPK